ncbi:MAG: energy-coupling factor ABC transporter permease, partial [Gammaproteobacteria bacterium]
SHVYFGAIACIVVLWILRAGIGAGYNFHLLGATTLCLMFEWQFALLAVSLALIITTWQHQAGWEAFALNALIMGALPILVTRLLLYFSQRWLVHHFFIYIFLNAFLAGALGMLLCSLAAAAVLKLAVSDGAPLGGPGYLAVVPLLMFGEAFLSGMMMTLLVAYRPRWVATFHDHWYLDGK